MWTRFFHHSLWLETKTVSIIGYFCTAHNDFSDLKGEIRHWRRKNPYIDETCDQQAKYIFVNLLLEWIMMTYN